MPARTIIRLSSAEYHRLNEDCGGACLACGAIREDGLEPDAKGRRCDACGARKVAGIEQCVILGRVQLTDGITGRVGPIDDDE